MWSSSSDPETMRQAWNEGVEGKYADTTSEFFMCMMPYNAMAVDWKSMAMKEIEDMKEVMDMIA